MTLRGQVYILLPVAFVGCGQSTRLHSELGPPKRIHQPTEPAGLRQEFVSLMEAVKAAEAGPDRIAVLRNGMERFAGTRYEKLIESLITKEQDRTAAERLRAIMADPSLNRLQRLRLCQEFFEGTSYEKKFRKLIEEAERRERAKGPRDETKD